MGNGNKGLNRQGRYFSSMETSLYVTLIETRLSKCLSFSKCYYRHSELILNAFFINSSAARHIRTWVLWLFSLF